jgi:hypothetical protein
MKLLAALAVAPMPVLLSLHPRVAKLIECWGWEPSGMLRLTEPLGYFDFLRMLRDSALVVSDSRGVTRDALFAGKGSIVPLDNFWWTEAVEAGHTLAVGQDFGRMADALETFRPDGDSRAIVAHAFGEGDAAERVAKAVVEMLDARDGAGGREGPWHRLGYFDEIPAVGNRSAFSYNAFRGMVREIRSAGYEFVSFKGVLDAPPAAPYCLMRHDIDFDLSVACDLARVEAEEGVVATYFFMIRTNHYNVFAEEGSILVREILGLGHDLGLHFDTASYVALTGPSSYREAVAREADMLEQWFGVPVSAVSFHRPKAIVLDGNPELTAPRLHTYDQSLRKTAEYVSDSGGVWKYGTPLSREAFRTRQPLHICTHPVWWSEVPTSPFETLLRLTDDRRARDDESFAKNCRPYRVGRLARSLDFAD